MNIVIYLETKVKVYIMNVEPYDGLCFDEEYHG